MRFLYIVKSIHRKIFILIGLSFFLSATVIAQAPANDNCAGAITLTSSTVTCSNPVNGTIDNATRSIGTTTASSCVAWSANYDVWYKFVAVATTHTITINNFGANFWNPEVQIYASPCPAVSTGYLACGIASGGSAVATSTALTVGSTYYVRVSDSWNPHTSGSGFTICLTHPLLSSVNNTCATAFSLTPGITCSSITANMQNANSAAPAGCTATTLTTFDVWFKFTATSTTQTITLSNLGSSLTAANTYIETFSGTCAGLTSLGCQTAATRQTITGLTVGTTYYTRAFVKTSPTAGATTTWNFDICVQGQPANDECTGAVTLTSNTTCTNTAGTLDLATANATNPIGCFAAGTYYDVWYRFVAVTPTHTVTLSSLGTNFTAPRIQVYQGTCGSLTSMSCVSGSTLTQSGLTVGNVYYVRVANFNTNPSGTGTVAGFNICITHTNDLCSGATLLSSGSTCTNVAGTLLNATATAGLSACGNASSADVWYYFVAQSNHPVITLSSVGSNLSAASPLIQLFTGSCGTLTAVPGVCGASPLNTAVSPGGTGLTINTTYYVRITTNTNTGSPSSGNWGFNICITNPNEALVDYGKCYVNITNGTSGGTINPGDVLEIRATLVISGPGTTVAIDSLAYYDTLTAGKGLALIKDSMALRTNEGKLFRPSNSTCYTDAKDVLDAAWITTAGAGSDTALQINMGEGATWAKRGILRNTSKPSNFGSTCIVMATYRVRVNGAYGTKVRYGGGAFRYRDTITNTSYVINFPKDSLMIYASPGGCPDAVSPTNVVGDESNGTFGTPSGNPTYFQNRGTSANTKYAYGPFNTGSPADYFYSVANNSSANASTVQTLTKPEGGGNRVFGVWDISGDHTGATNTAKGNPPCNVNLPISASNPCGYMLVVNSAYRADVAFEYNFSGACTDTYYEISAWLKNVCAKCGCDSNGVGASSTGYSPTASGDSAGVRPNIAFQIDGVDYYTTGDLVYQGLSGTQTGSDTLNKWVKRSFVYKTGPNQTSFKMSFRNNAPGGGGNDWAVDDISMRTCYPNMIYSPSNTPAVCTGHPLTLSDTVSSYYNVYIYYKWQRSTDGGVTWVDVAGTAGIASPVLVGPNNYRFVNSYTLPPTATSLSNAGDKYRMVVATNAANLAGVSCNYTDVAPVTISIINTCIDIDDDNDGIPDYVEFNNPLALQDANGNGIPNWNDASYPGYVDNNFDFVNDNFDYGADSDNDGIPNYRDTDFPGFVDSNGDGVNDNADRDKDGIINQYDLDSDNDGIPDTVESYGVEANGDGIIDSYVDTDNDGFSQNVDANNTGVAGSGTGLGAQDLDGDGVPNYLDTDSDNDGIPDVIEAAGNDTNNDGKIDSFSDLNGDGLSDNDINATALLKTGLDVSPVDGRADDFPNKNLDRDFRPNAYDLDSDGDGIADVIEAGLPDANLNGIVDGTIAINGWSTTVSAMGTLNLRNTDASGNPDYLDIDSDNDGIPDNIEGMSTAGYIMPTLTDTDGDGLANVYDNVVGFGGAGIFVYDHDGDGIPDYRDLDTDGDGQADIIEGNDFNLNGLMDDNVTLTGVDTDGDGLDNRFDSLNSVTNVKGTSYRMGTGGTLTGDATPGSRCTVQKKTVGQINRDWRFVGVVLPVEFLSFSGLPKQNTVLLNWSIIATKDIDHFEVERSTDNSSYAYVGIVNDAVQLNEPQSFSYTDDISGITNEIIYYRLKVIGKAGEIKYSNVLVVRQAQVKAPVSIVPNPASDFVLVRLTAEKESLVTLRLVDNLGKTVLQQQQRVFKGNNVLQLSGLSKYSAGVYSLQLLMNDEVVTQKLILEK
ncbi:T9SS type A sorting domain-containing protein [Ferruginibacter sp.]